VCGEFDKRARERSLGVWASLHRWILALGILGVTGGFHAACHNHNRSWYEKIRDIAG